MFVDPLNGNLHLKSSATTAIDQVDTIADALVDIDGQSRSLGTKVEVGADEVTALTPVSLPQ